MTHLNIVRFISMKFKYNNILTMSEKNGKKVTFNEKNDSNTEVSNTEVSNTTVLTNTNDNDVDEKKDTIKIVNFFGTKYATSDGDLVKLLNDKDYKMGKSENNEDKSFYERLLIDILAPDEDNNKKKEYDIKVRFYRQPKLNTKGTYIYDVELLVENEARPFHSLDQVDYFLKNYIGRYENSLLKEDDPKRKDDSLFLNKIEKSIKHFIAEYDSDKKLIVRDDNGTIIDDKVGGRFKKRYSKKRSLKKRSLKNKSLKKK